MSTITHSQPNTKKTGPPNGVAVINSNSTTPAQTPSTNGSMAPQQQEPSPSQSTSPPANNAPKYGTLVPNRVFVGGISANTTEVELAQLFSAYGNVKATKIISDRAGVSKGYGFVTFESEEEAKRLQRESENIILRERRLNIAPAIKKQPFSRSFDVPSPPPSGPAPAHYYYASAPAGGVGYAYQNGMAYYTHTPPTSGCATGEPGPGQAAAAAAAVYQAPPVYAAAPTAAPPTAPYAMPLYPHQPLYVQHQYPYQPLQYSGPPQFYGAGPPPQYMYRGAQQPGIAPSTATSVGTQTSTTSSSNSTSSGSVGPLTGYPNGAAGIATHSGYQPHTLPNTSVPPPMPNHGHHAASEASGRYTTNAPAYGCAQIGYATSNALFYNLPMYALDPAPGAYPDSLRNATPIPMQEPPHPGLEQTPMAGTMMVRAASPHRAHSAAPHLPPNTGALPKVLQRPMTVQPPPPPQHGQQQYSQAGRQFFPYPYAMPGTDQANSYSHPPPPKPVPPPSAQLMAPPVQAVASQLMPQPVAEPKPTPVVSLLSVGQGNERDFRSMQGGRKFRPVKPHDAGGNGASPYRAAGQSFRAAGQPVFAFPPANGHPADDGRPGRRLERCDSAICRSWSRRRRNFSQADSLSVRTHSNSSANANFDENLNERKDRPVDMRVDKRGDGRGPGRDYLDNGRPRFQSAAPRGRPVNNGQLWEEPRPHIRAPAPLNIQTPAVLGCGRRKRRNPPRRTPTIVRCSSLDEATQAADADAPCPLDVVSDDLQQMGI